MSQPAKRHPVFVTTSPGLESALFRELKELGFGDLSKGRAGVSLRTDRVGLERLTASTRLGHRVLWQLAEVDAQDGDTLYRQVREAVRWAGLIPTEPGQAKTFAVHATCRDTPAFRDARYAGLRVKDAICDSAREQTGRRPDVDTEDPDVFVRVSIVRGRGVVSLDAAGKVSLHARGYRTDSGEAPLRETLAAALPILADWDFASPLIDPMCGSGTIVIEAALRALGVLPARLSRLRAPYGFTRWPGFRAERFAGWRDTNGPAMELPRGVRLVGSDHDDAALATARVNAERADVRAHVELVGGDARDPGHVARLASLVAGFDKPGLIATNPPWGGRMLDQQAAAVLLKDAVDVWRVVFPGWRLAVLSPNAASVEALHMKKPRLVPLESGALEVMWPADRPRWRRARRGAKSP